MNIVILGAAGFIGTNLTLELSKNEQDKITVVDQEKEYFHKFPIKENIEIKLIKFHRDMKFDNILEGQDIVYHLISTNNPSSSNKNIGSDITDNISISINLLESCIKNKVKKIIFISSGGTVYGKVDSFPIKEDEVTKPITTYGIQKLTIEKLLYLYGYLYGIDYSIVRLSNPYGPYQRPNGNLGVITNFIYKALKNEKIVVYGDGTVIRDYIYISDAIEGIIKIANNYSDEKIFNLGSGIGTSINEIIKIIKNNFNENLQIEYIEKRLVDVPINYLDISRFESIFGRQCNKSLLDGMILTKKFLENYLKG